MSILPRADSKSPIFILVVFAIVMGFLGWEMFQFRLAGKKVHGVEVHVLPSQLTLKPGERHLLEAVVIGSEDPDVGWSIEEQSGGTIASAKASVHDGRLFSAANYTAPANPGVYHVIAGSKADETRTALATITVAP